jgi:CubicO group peptidase (beta-lactamase class C family)
MQHFPAAGAWTLADTQDAGFDPIALATALQFATDAETAWPRDLGTGLNADPNSNEPPPWNEVLGPTQDRTGPNGVIIRDGRLVATYGDPSVVDMTFSVAKSYLAVLTGIAVRKGLIPDIDEPVREHAPAPDLNTDQNRTITWRHFLNQTSEWEGTLWSKPDLIDRNRQVGQNADNSRKGQHRDLGAPGSLYEYNDVRVNRLSLALMQVFGRELPDVLREEIMAPIGASSNWHWHGYRNSTATINGAQLTSVPGGSHWGGGVFMNSEDHARFGLLIARDGIWNGKALLPAGWVDELVRPSQCKADYGALWWLNTEREHYPSAPQSSFFAVGAGSNIIWIDRTMDLVMVMRWIDGGSVDKLIGQVMGAMK